MQATCAGLATATLEMVWIVSLAFLNSQSRTSFRSSSSRPARKTLFNPKAEGIATKPTWVLTEYAFLFRSPEGVTEVAHETHRTGLFSAQAWLRLLTDAGFRPRIVTEVTREERSPRQVLVGHRVA